MIGACVLISSEEIWNVVNHVVENLVTFWKVSIVVYVGTVAIAVFYQNSMQLHNNKIALVLITVSHSFYIGSLVSFLTLVVSLA